MAEKTITLEELPTPDQADCLDMIRTDDLNKEQVIELMTTLETKGWTWASGLMPTESLPPKGFGVHLGLRYDKYLFYRSKSSMAVNCRDFRMYSLVQRVTSTTLKSSSHCPLCGSSGDDIVFDFYCNNKGCRNYHK